MYKDLVICIIDTGGSGVELARRLAKDFHKTYYFLEWRSDGYPKANTYYIGTGLKEIERIHDIFNYIDIIDIFLFTDILYSDLQKHLMSLGKLVIGARDAELLETCRFFLKDKLTELGLDTIPYEKIKGIKNLENYLKENDNKYVKIDMFRNTTETFHADNFSLIEPYIDNLDNKLGPVLSNELNFLVEDEIEDAIESGIDIYTSNGNFPSKWMYGIEIKNKCYAGEITNNIPEKLQIIKKFSKYFKQCNYRGFVSTEQRITKDKNYLTDMTCRIPLPPGQLEQFMWKNLSQIIVETAKGNIIDIQNTFSYGFEMFITSKWAEDNWIELQFPEEYRDNIFIERLIQYNNKYYSIPYGSKYVCSVATEGNSLDEAIQKNLEICKLIKGIDLDYDESAIIDLQEQLKRKNNLQ